MTQTFDSPAAMVDTLRPDIPVFCMRPHVIRAAARQFVDTFPGRVLYAIKCNNDRRVVRALYEGGIRHFDTASIPEVEQVNDQFVEAHCYYMHPVKSRSAIREAYENYGIRAFALDDETELAKIKDEIADLSDLTLMVRLEAVRAQAVCDLGGKFGATPERAAALLRRCVAAGARVGLTFHVGSQCLSPQAYVNMILQAGAVREKSGVDLAVLDVGGGFPVPYVGAIPPDLSQYVEAIGRAVDQIGISPRTELFCEPGRALVGGGVSLVVRILLRRDDQIYLNDGVYGSLMDLRTEGIDLPMRVIRPGGYTRGELQAFDLFGPTCDSIDHMPGPYWLPEDIQEGDWIEIGQCGAYSNVLRTGFNGFYDAQWVFTKDDAFQPTNDMLPRTLRSKVAAE